MTPTFDKVHNRFKFNGLHFNREDLKEVAYSLIKEGVPYERIIGDFLTDWLNDDDFMYVKTSGSTGAPKSIKLQKQAMVDSAIATGDYFNLNPGDTILHCLPSQYIAGKMMLVRDMMLGLELDYIEPTTTINFDSNKRYDFAAMVPLQVYNALDKINSIDKLIIGGSKVSLELQKELSKVSTKCFETYGMTETITHVAVRPLKSTTQEQNDYFEALQNVHFSQDNRDCLVIKADRLRDDPFVTNDIVELKSETSFKWLGRFDNIINSGGVKLSPEQIEAKLQHIIEDRFIISFENDEQLGEKIILIVENEAIDIDRLRSEIQAVASLTKFEIPKAIYKVSNLEETVNGKIHREKSRVAALA